jgi:hypothetical protein
MIKIMVFVESERILIRHKINCILYNDAIDSFVESATTNQCDENIR